MTIEMMIESISDSHSSSDIQQFLFEYQRSPLWSLDMLEELSNIESVDRDIDNVESVKAKLITALTNELNRYHTNQTEYIPELDAENDILWFNKIHNMILKMFQNKKYKTQEEFDDAMMWLIRMYDSMKCENNSPKLLDY